MKPILGISTTSELHPIYFEQFLIYRQFLQQDKRDDFKALVLSGLFLCISIESYINWVIRWLLEHVNYKENRKVKKIWENSFQSRKYLFEKLQFFKDVFLSDDADLEVIKCFLDKIRVLRNKIVHGHEEHGITQWSDGKVDKTRFAKLLTYQEIENYYNEFQNCMKSIRSLIEKIEMRELTSGIPNREWVIKYLTFPGGTHNDYAIIDE